MSLRVLLALLILAALVASFAISLLAPQVVPPESLEFISWLTGPVPFDTLVTLVTGTLISIVFFLIVNELIVRPLRRIHKALAGFASAQEPIELPRFTLSPREIRDLGTEVGTFARNVAEAHARDQEMSRVKSDFISTAAHQLRTPLTGIRWSLEALEKEPLTESQMLLVKSAVDKSHDLVGVVGTLLDITSIESGKYQYQFVVEDVATLIAEVVNDFLPFAEGAGVSLSFVPGITPPVRMDRERMKWVLNNLIENAIRYTPSGGSVQITTEAVTGRVIVRVRDTGIGINVEDRNNIFERFFRGGNAVTKNNQGNGLGLYIARSIVKDHGGELSFEGNQDGPGTTFTLALPG